MIIKFVLIIIVSVGYRGGVSTTEVRNPYTTSIGCEEAAKLIRNKNFNGPHIIAKCLPVEVLK